MTKKQTEEMKSSIERKQKAANEAQQKQSDIPDMNLDDDDGSSK